MDVISFTPVRTDPATLELFLDRLDAQHLADSWAYDDNVLPASSGLLAASLELLPRLDLPEADYRVSDDTHYWGSGADHRVAQIKNQAIDLFLAETDATHLFLCDADVILLPGTVEHLASLGLPVVSEVYWTRWRPTDPLMPNVWDHGHYGFWSAESLHRLAEPGQYRVGGLGACTLIERSVLERIRFDPIPGWPMWGEDRWFCLRAAVAGVELWADTVKTPWHVYRSADLDQARTWDEETAYRWKMEHLGRAWRALFR